MDRHARMVRRRPDVRRRPADGFRLADRARFAQVAALALRGLSGSVGRAAAAAELVVEDVPDPAQPAVLAAFEPRTDGPARLTLYRRPLELRAESKPDLAELLRDTVRAAIGGALGRGDEA